MFVRCHLWLIYTSKISSLLSIKKNLAYNFLLSLSQVMLPLISIPYISRVLDPDGIGRVSFVDSFTYYFMSIAEFGIVVYGMREVAKKKNDQVEMRKLVSELLTLHIISSGFALILYLISVYLVWDKIHDFRLFLFSLSFLLVNFFACEWYFIGLEKFKYITLRSLCTRILGLASVFLIVKEPGDYYLYYAIMVVAAIVNSIWNNIILFREIPISFRNTDWKKHIVHTRITYFISLIYGVTLMLDNVLLRLVSSSAAVGFYAFSMKICRTAGILLSDSLLVFFPRIVSLRNAGDRNGMQAMLSKNLQLVILFCIPLCAGLYLLAAPLVNIILGPQFDPSITDLKILAFYPFLKVYNLFLSKQVLISHNQERLYMKSLSITGVLFIILTLILSYLYADKGACYAIILSEIAGVLLNYYYCKKVDADLKIFDMPSLLHSLAGVIVFIPIIYLINETEPSPLTVILVSVPLCFIIYIILQVFIFKNSFMILIRDIIYGLIKNKPAD